MKKSELKSIIKECVDEVTELNEALGDLATTFSAMKHKLMQDLLDSGVASKDAKKVGKSIDDVWAAYLKTKNSVKK